MCIRIYIYIYLWEGRGWYSHYHEFVLMERRASQVKGVFVFVFVLFLMGAPKGVRVLVGAGRGKREKGKWWIPIH